MTDNKPNNRKTGPGSRVAGARANGVKLAADGKTFKQRYARPNMAKAYQEGFDSFASEDTGEK